jgi:hypothetical protein
VHEGNVSIVVWAAGKGLIIVEAGMDLIEGQKCFGSSGKSPTIRGYDHAITLEGATHFGCDYCKILVKGWLSTGQIEADVGGGILSTDVTAR